MLKKEYSVLNEIRIKGNSLLHNYNYFANKNPGSHLAIVIKSNAYGHGLVPIAKFIENNLPSIPFLCADSLYEAYELTNADVNLPILIMGYTNPVNYQVSKTLPYIFGVSDTETIHALGKYQPNARLHLEIDTGMSRLGFRHDEIDECAKALRQYPSLKVEGIFSHFSQADDPSQATFTRSQVKQFKIIATHLESLGFTFKYKHIAATAGAETISDPYFNLIRLGLGFYGYSPFGPHTQEGRGQRQNLQPAMSLVSHLARIKQINPGDKVGYGATYTAKQKETIAVLPMGYNEGLSRTLSNRGKVMINNTPCPIIGRISMNMTTIKLKRTISPQLGDEVVVISSDPNSQNSLYQLSQLENTIPYTVLTSLHATIRRKII